MKIIKTLATVGMIASLAACGSLKGYDPECWVRSDDPRLSEGPVYCEDGTKKANVIYKSTGDNGDNGDNGDKGGSGERSGE